MQRTVKNIVLCVLLILTLCATAFTMYMAGDGSFAFGGNQNTQGQISDNQTDGQPPEMPNGDSNSQGQPSEMPNGDSNSQGQPPEMPNGDSNSQGQPPEMPNGDSNSQGQPPEMPNGDSNSQGQPPEMPNGDSNSQGQPPEMKNGESSEISIIYYSLFGIEGLVIALIITYLIMSGFNKRRFREAFNSAIRIIIAVVLIVVITGGMVFADKIVTEKVFISSSSSMGGEMGKPDDMNTSVSYSAKSEITEDKEITSGDYNSETADENAIMVKGDVKASLSGITVGKTGDSDGGDNTSFYGTNSAIIAKDGAKLTIDNLTLTTDAQGANGVFSYGGSATTNNSSSDGTEITISNSTITTTKDGSGGIMATGGGALTAENLTVETSGTSSAAIRTDRGGGTVKVTKGTYTTNGQGSPAVYSTADVTVNNAKLIANASEGIVIEGKNSVTLNSCDLTDSNTKLNGQSTTYKNIFLYQSVSGDAAEGTSEFTANDCNITTNKGDTFYITNTKALINIKNNTIINNDSEGNFLRVQKDSWGNSSSNGGDVTLNMESQNAVGNIVVDSISTLDMTMKSASYYEGTINGDNSGKSVKLTLDKSSKIKLTGDSYVTSLDDGDSTLSNIDFNGYTLYVNGKAYNC